MTKHTEDVVAIKKLAEDWSVGWDNSDTEALLSLYADDPVLMPQGQPAVVGRMLFVHFISPFLRSSQSRE